MYIKKLSSSVYQVEMLCDLYTGFEPSQLSCLGSLVGKSITWRADGRGFESHPRQPIFLTVSGKLCCVALPFCCVVVVVVALPFSASHGVIVHYCWL